MGAGAAGLAAANALGQAAQAAPAVSGSRNQASVSVGAPTFTTRATAGSLGQTLASELPTIGAIGLAGLVLWVVLK